MGVGVGVDVGVVVGDMICVSSVGCGVAVEWVITDSSSVKVDVEVVCTSLFCCDNGLNALVISIPGFRKLNKMIEAVMMTRLMPAPHNIRFPLFGVWAFSGASSGVVSLIGFSP